MPSKNLGGSEVHCVPAPWIVWEDSESSTVLVAYPDEPWKVTKERVKNYENRGKDWILYLAKIMYRTGEFLFTDNRFIELNWKKKTFF